jgi:TfoX/Sxy family transcriptional regulator of competence genes
MIAEVAYDEELAHRIRELLTDEARVSEMAMFGGLAFLVAGNMAVAASGRGGLMVRVSPDVAQRLLARPHARPMEMRGRKMNNWIRVDEEGIATKRQLGAWVRRGVQLARSLPPKG